jgi:AcrR family transcriptional regulator
MTSDTRVPRQERSIGKKLQITEAGLKLFSEKGYHNTNTKEIAAEAGVSVGTFYAYFEDKHDLFMEVLKEYIGKISRVLSSMPVGDYIQPGRERDFILLIVNTLLESHNISPAFHQEIEAMVHSDDKVRVLMEEMRKNSIEMTRTILKNWKSNLRRGNINAASIIIQHTIEDMVHAIKFTAMDVKPEILKNELAEMVYRYLYD